MRKIIVSLTSYPKRIRGIRKVLDSIMAQTYKPDKVVLYLSEEQFAEKKLPVNVSAYFSQGLEIHWCQNDMKSHKKYLYAFREYPNDYIITIDDDFYYEEHMIEELVQYIDRFPKCILARRTHLITAKRDGSISSYEKWWGECMHYIGMPHMDLFAVGCAGILYPPHLLSDEVFNTDNIKKYCMYADDIWLKIMELISNVPIVQVSTRLLDKFDEEFAQDGLYQQHNGNGGNDRQLYKLLEIYNYFKKIEESLVERIFSTGVIYEDEVEEKKQKDNIKIVNEYFNRIEWMTDIVIYGAGTMARCIYSMLKKYQIKCNIKAFAVKDTDKNVSCIDNINVVQYKNVDYKNTMCIIALADLKEQYLICQQLMLLGVQKRQICFLDKQILLALRGIR